METDDAIEHNRTEPIRKRMRIIFVTRHLTNGGAEREVAAFANALVQIGQEVCITYLHNIGIDYALDPRVQTFWQSPSRVSVPKLRGLCNHILSIKQLRGLSGDVLISDNLSLERNWRIWVSTLFSKTKMVYAILNNVEQKYPEKKRRRRHEQICRMADAIWIQTEEQKKLLPAGVQEKIFEVRNILDRKFLDTRKRYRGEIVHFISAGRLHPQKNQALLIEAFAKMVERTANDKATLTIYGKEKEDIFGTEKKLRELIQKYHLEKRVFLAGWVKDMEVRYTQADAFVFGSDYEGLPNALMEAMASGLPCISTDCPTGPSVLIHSGENGLLVPVGDKEAMSAAMQYFMENPQEAEQMGMAAKQRMERWGNPEEIAGELLNQLKKVCSG